ncbi:diguanylate cyclase [Nodosilinea sp. LEGE 06152]|uniref:histidine kinase N-terminal 7TM domain-containing diguanylate cyclase n=1 Tax=Nodosilinea sp. LEGE 06152 TaxID=2777966 RepID=UPI00188177DD|nr:histidine kinase N-terminal 7TM domain-containing protein [Nodosilinea sp. LEGE 06152]MBE9156661.1 diguanylate cyclase [Nodosilinea sp. LEGE 06152]MBE9160508.1 diguanylate cyclase [Nodosilinea sp. LEGE 06152]
MDFQLNLSFGVLALTAVINVLVASMAWQRRGATLARTYFSLMMVAATFYAVVAAMEAGSVAIADKIFWSTLEYVGTGGIIVFFLLFAEAFARERSRFRPKQLVQLSFWPLFNVILVATNSWHHWVWTAVLPGLPPSTSAVYEHGPGYFWILSCIYLYGLRSFQLLAHATFRGGPLRRRQALFLLLGALFPYVSGALYSLEITPAGLNLTPMSFMATGLFFFWALFRMGAFDAVPIAREMLIEHLQDGVIVVDLQHRIVDINPQGRSLTSLKGDCLGRSLHLVLADFPELLNNYDHGLETPFGLWLNSQPLLYATVQISPLSDYQGQIHGRLLILHDITKRYQAEVELRQANDRLQHQLEEIKFLQASLKVQARHQLTGLFNRHYLSEILPKTLQKAEQAGYSVVFVMFDIDHFKHINDTFGHRVGDLVLKSFSQILLQQMEADDIPFRLGGEEFLVVFPGLALNAGQQRAEAIRRTFETLSVPWSGAEVKTTVSGGVAIFPNQGINDDDLLHAADLALYEAKKTGRNRIVCSGSLHC